jgi:hypothetical protein
MVAFRTQAETDNWVSVREFMTVIDQTTGRSRLSRIH